MTRHGVSVVEMRILHRIKLDLAASVHLQTHPPILADAFDGPSSRLPASSLAMAR